MGLSLMVLNDDDSGTACFIHSHGLKEQSQQRTKNHYSICCCLCYVVKKVPMKPNQPKNDFPKNAMSWCKRKDNKKYSNCSVVHIVPFFFILQHFDITTKSKTQKQRLSRDCRCFSYKRNQKKIIITDRQ